MTHRRPNGFGLDLSVALCLVVAASFATPGVVVAQCIDGSGPCDEPHPGPGCDVAECCEFVCDADPVCCESEWDELCADIAIQECGGLACPGRTPCADAGLDPGCDDRDCCRLVCDHDSFCCFVAWDEICAERAERLCPSFPPCELVIPVEAIDEGEPCYDRTNDGCSLLEPAYSSIECGDLVHGTSSTDGPRDTDWWRFDLAETTVVRFELRAEFPAEAHVVTGPCEGPTSTIATFTAIDCTESVLEIALGPGTHALVIAPGTARAAIRQRLTCDLEDPDDPPDPGDPKPEPSIFGLDYLLAFECDVRDPADLDGDGRVSGSDVTILLAAWGASGGPEDLDGSGLVDGADLLIVLASWTG